MNRNEQQRRVVTVGVIGTGKVSHELACDALNRHFFMGPEDSEGYFGPSSQYDVRMVIPCSEELTQDGILAVWQWVVRCELTYKALVEGELTRPELEAVVDTTGEDSDVLEVDSVQASLIELMEQFENPLLLVISTEGQHLDSAAQAVAAQALTRGITVLDLGRVLRELDWSHLPDQEQPVEEGEFVEENGQTTLFAVADIDQGEGLVFSPEEVRVLGEALDSSMDYLLDLRGAFERLDAQAKVLVRAKSLLAPKPDPAPEGAKRYLEVYDEAKGVWVKKGRGRPSAGQNAQWVGEDGTRVPYRATEA